MAAGFKQATVNASDVPSTQTDFPAYVDLSRLGITTLAEAQSVRVYADSSKTTEWAREIVSEVEMHVKVPSLTSTVTMYVDWDGVSADYAVTDTYGRNAVWTGYQGVWHMDGSVTDSTSNGNNGTDTSVTYTGTKLGDYFNVSGTGFSSLTDSAALNFSGSYTISFWTRTTSTNFGSPYSFMSLSGSFKGVAIRMNNSSPNKWVWNHMHSTGDSGDMTSSGQVNSGSWLLSHFVYDTSANNREIFLNGASDSNLAETNDATWAVDYFRIGARKFGAGAEDIHFTGDIDEVRATNVARSDDWITTEYNNQSDEAGFWGTWTDVGGGGGVVLPQFKGFARL